MAGVCTGDGPCDVTPLGAGKNWVTEVGGLPLYIRAIAQALLRSGHTESGAIQLAVGTVQRWARGGGKVTAETRARAAAALAEWEAKRAAAHALSNGGEMSIDLADTVSASDGQTMTVNSTTKSITDGTCVYDPKGDELDNVSQQVRGINALHRSGRTAQAKTAMDGLVRSKTSRARKMPDGTTRAHTPTEVKAGLSRLGAVNLSRVDLAGFNPSQPRAFGGKWGSGGSSAAASPAATTTQAKSIGVDPAVLAAMAKQLGLSTTQVTALVQQANAAKANKGKKAGGGGAKKKVGGAGKAGAAKKAQAAAAKKAQAAQTTAQKRQAATQLKAANQAVAAAKKSASVSVASSSPVTKASTAKANAINGLPPAQKSLLVGSVPPAGYSWSGTSLVHLSGQHRSVDLATTEELLPDMDAVRKAAGKLSALPAALRKSMAARLAARAKELGATLNLAVPMNERAAARDQAKSEGKTFDGTTSYPTQTRALFDKAVMAVGRGGADHDKIRAYLIRRAKAEGWEDGIPANWGADGSLKEAA